MARYKTTIEVITEADNRLEAMDIAGEYLRGNLDSGVVMKCHIENVNAYRKMKCALTSFAVLFALTAAMVSYFTFVPVSAPIAQNGSAVNAGMMVKRNVMQPSLKTGNEDLKERWTKKQAKLILEKLPEVN